MRAKVKAAARARAKVANPNQDLLDKLITRRIFLDRYSERQARGVIKLLRQVRDDTAAKLARLRARGAAELTVKRREAFLKEVDELMSSIYGKVTAGMTSDFDDFAKQQAVWTANTLEAVGAGARVSTISTATALGAYKARPQNGRFTKDLIKLFDANQRARIIEQLRISFVEGESLTTATSRLRNITQTNARFARAFIRTTNSHIGSVVSDEVYRANDDLIELYEWLSILDGRTTPICRGRDGRRYEVGKGPMPPAHIGCRSTTTPILKDFPPPQRETFDEWIKRQDADKQNDILGPARAALVRDGASVRNFVDTTGRTLTLKQLGAM